MTSAILACAIFVWPALCTVAPEPGPDQAWLLGTPLCLQLGCHFPRRPAGDFKSLAAPRDAAPLMRGDARREK
eukprot:9003204-Heterocapsa_arctica.AAC.1